MDFSYNFEADWLDAQADIYDEQRDGLVVCPECGELVEPDVTDSTGMFMTEICPICQAIF